LLGLSLQVVADRMDVSPQAVHQFEKSEDAGTISLRQLGNVAAALGCRLTYSLCAPDGSPAVKSGRKPRPVSVAPEAPAPEPAAPTVEHSMFLQNQADGRFD
jgi:transcriptional regulator with XRE-family HTH domain